MSIYYKLYQFLQKPHGLNIMIKFGFESKLMGQDGCNIGKKYT
jgi:hypothetical protein